MRALWIVVIAAACGKGDKKDAPKAEPFKGPLTVAKVMAAKDAVKPFDPWDTGLAKLESVVGPPTKVDGSKHYWAAMEGDDCAYFYVEQEDGAKYNKKGLMVGASQSPMTVAKDGPIMNRAECLKLVGKGVAAEDPNAPAPRTDGPAYEVSELQKLAVGGRSKWKDKQVRVTGNVTQMMGDEALLRDRVDSDVSVSCKMDAGQAEPPMKGTVVLQGIVDIEEFVTGAGNPGARAHLSKCSLVTLDCKAKVAEMHAYFDLLKAAGAKAPKPWPTGDDKTNTAIRDAIDKLNKTLAKAKAADLAKGMSDADAPLLAKCAPAAARHKEVVKSKDADRLALIQSIGDKFAECECQGDMSLWLARQYIGLYVASGGALDKPLSY